MKNFDEALDEVFGRETEKLPLKLQNDLSMAQDYANNEKLADIIDEHLVALSVQSVKMEQEEDDYEASVFLTAFHAGRLVGHAEQRQELNVDKLMAVRT